METDKRYSEKVQYTPVAEENGKNCSAADDSEVSPGGESHRYPGDG